MTGTLNRFFRAASLVVTDRRWAAPLSAMALGFGLFIGVAIGPNAAGTLAGVSPIVEIPDFRGGTGEEAGGDGGSPILAGPGDGSAGGGGALGALPAPAPLAVPPSEPQPPAGKPPQATKPREEPAETEETVALRGIVVHTNPAAGSYALAIDGGELVSVHAAELPLPGTKLSLAARRLANNTFAEAEPRDPEGEAKRASFRGVVTFADPTPTAPAYTVSGRGASIPVHVRPDPAGAAPQLPVLGSYATVTVEIEDQATSVSSSEPPLAPAPPASSPPVPASTIPPAACGPDPNLPSLKAFAPAALLWQHHVEVEGEPATYIDLAGVVSALCPEASQILLSADSARESNSDLTLTVPARIDTSKLERGDSILATATIEPDGTLTLAGLAGDERIKGADNPSSAQGDLKRP